MTNDATAILEELRQDHRNMALVLNLLDRESNRIYAGGNADFELVYDIMLYMTVYPDAVHHPKEDRIYAELKAARPDLSSGMSKITEEHRSIAEHGLTLRQTVEAVISGEIVRRNTVVADILRYVNTLRSHMQWEERDLFRRIDKMIADGHGKISEATLVAGDDPVFGDSVERKFARLFETIKLADTLTPS